MNLRNITEVTQKELDAFPDATPISESGNSLIDLDEEVKD